MLDLAPHHKALLLAILNTHLPGARVWAFGSRVTGRARPFSDLDLAVEGAAPIDTRTFVALVARSKGTSRRSHASRIVTVGAVAWTRPSCVSASTRANASFGAAVTARRRTHALKT